MITIFFKFYLILFNFLLFDIIFGCFFLIFFGFGFYLIIILQGGPQNEPALLKMMLLSRFVFSCPISVDFKLIFSRVIFLLFFYHF